MTCLDFQKMLSGYIDGELSEEDTRSIAGHLDNCAACRKEYKALNDLDGLIKGLPALAVSDQFCTELEIRLDRKKGRAGRPHPLTWGVLFIRDCLEEILSELVEPSLDGSDILDEFHDLPPYSLGRIYLKII